MRYLLIFLLFFFVSCKRYKYSTKGGGYYHNSIYFGKDRSKNTRKGIKDGCKTAKGIYQKSHILFNENSDYNKGWFLGRNRCDQKEKKEI